jgi:hypothetical protein
MKHSCFVVFVADSGSRSAGRVKIEVQQLARSHQRKCPNDIRYSLVSCKGERGKGLPIQRRGPGCNIEVVKEHIGE